MIIRAIALTLLPLIVLAAPGAAQQDTTVLPDIVVTADRRPVPADLVTSRITVITGKELRARGVRQVMDALRGVPGVTVVQGGSFGSAASLFVRGGESDYVRVLVDGVPLNEPGGAFDFAHLSTDNIERIEVLRGPASVVHGSDAVTGVVQIVTRSGAGGSRAFATAEGGSFGSARVTVGASGGSEVAGFSIGLSRFASDGLYAFNNDYANTAASGRFTVRPDERTDATFTVRYTDARHHFPTDGAGVPVDSNQFTTNEATALGIDVGRFLTRRLEARVQVGLSEIATLYDDRSDGPADTIGFFAFRSQTQFRTRSADGRVSYYVTPTTVVTAGASINQEWQRTDSDIARRNRAYYAQVTAGTFAGISVNGGIRVDDNERFGTFVTYRAGAAYRLPTGTRVHVSAASGFKAPTFLETFDGAFSTGNPNLDPERSESWEGGVDQPLLGGRLLVSATGFVQRFSDLIQYTFAPPGPGDPNYFNVAAADADGAEVELRAAVLPSLRIAASYTYLHTEVADAGFDTGSDAAFVTGDRLLRRPRHAAALQAHYRLADRATLGAEVRRVGGRDDRDFSAFPAVRLELPAHTVLDLSATMEVLATRPGVPGLTVTARIENLLDEAYQEVVGFPARRRTVMVGGRIEVR